jgi:hypothetical protein
MKPWKSWSKNAVGMAGAMLLVSVFAFSQADQTSPARAKPAPKQAGSKTTTSSATHRSSKAQPTKSGTASTRSTSRKGKGSRKSWRRGQQKVDATRARQIQEALIRQHYLSGSATGKWDATTEDALRRYQGDNGWQNKTVPDSRALIKLGLGPSHDHLLNPESAMTTALEPPRKSRTPATQSTDAVDSAGPSNQPQP